MTSASIRRSLFLLAAVVISSAHAEQAAPRSIITPPAAPGSEDYQEVVNAYLNGLAPKVIGGTKAVDGAYPWQVSLDVSWIADPYRSHFCGGSVYSDHWIVTAAHCVNTLKPTDVIVSAGSNSLTDGRVRRNVRQIILHSAYTASNHANDIALLEIFGDPLPVTETSSAIRSVPLASLGAESFTTGIEPTQGVHQGTWFEVTGWGSTVEKGSQVRDLRMALVPYRSSDKKVEKSCARDIAYGNAVMDKMLCAGNDHDACQGDSGGPLIFRDGASVSLVGIVSWGKGCARANKPGVYTDVAKYESWIRACTANPASCP